jgi:hypothetical protein
MIVLIFFPAKMENKNVLITAKAYNMLINEYNLKPEQLLAKLPQLDIKINSPKTGRFIQYGGKTYRDLLSLYSAEDLHKRRNGYIISPLSRAPVQVFGKTFNTLLTNYALDDLLLYPRVSRGGKMIVTPLTIKDNIKINTKLLLGPKISIDELIKSKKKVILYISALNKEKNDDKECVCMYEAAVIFENGTLISMYEAIEHKLVTEDLEYKMENRIPDIVEDYEGLLKFLCEYNEDFLTNLKVYDNAYEVDHKMVEQKYQDVLGCTKYIDLIKLHMWFITHVDLVSEKRKRFIINARLTKGNKELYDESESFDDNYEHFKDVIENKQLLMKEIKGFYKLLK